MIQKIKNLSFNKINKINYNKGITDENITNSNNKNTNNVTNLNKDFNFIDYSHQKTSIIKRLCYCIFPFLYKQDLISIRKLKVNTIYNNHKTIHTNAIKNQKYNLFTVIPLVLINQFSLFANQFYLVMIMSQFIDSLKVGYLVGYLAPLLFVLLTTLFKESYDDFQRYKQDKYINNYKYTRIRYNLKKSCNCSVTCNYSCKVIEEFIKSKDLKVGDLLKIKQNDRIPADCIILQSSNNQIFIKTDQLDGETDWKLRKPVKLIQQIYSNINDYLYFESLNQEKKNCNIKNKRRNSDLLYNTNNNNFSSIEYFVSPPSKSIYEFHGSIVFNKNSINDLNNINISENQSLIKESLGLENTIWSSSILASSDALCMVIYIGNETRCRMNTNKMERKLGKLDLEINFLSKVLFLVMIILALIVVLLKDNGIVSISISLLAFFRFVVLFCSIIPISLRVNLDISKTFFSYKISSDNKYIPDTIARNSTMPEDLGRIEYVFSDKTGTLTKNEMVFKSLALESEVFGHDTINEIRKIIVDDFQKFDSPFFDLINKLQDNNIISYSLDETIINNSIELINNDLNKEENSICNNKYKSSPYNIIKELDSNSLNYKKDFKNSKDLNVHEEIYYTNKKFKRIKKKVLRDAISAMALCNSVNVLHNENDKNKENNVKNIAISNKENINSFFKETEMSRFDSCSNTKDIIDNEINISYNKNYNKLSQEKLFKVNDIKKKLDKDELSMLSNSEYDINSYYKDSIKLVNEKNIPNYQASSPDEIALVKTAASLGYQLYYRDEKTIKLKIIINDNDFLNTTNKSVENTEKETYSKINFYFEEYEILHSFPFSSETKKMGIILRNKKYNYIVYYIKGAESIIQHFLKKEYHSIMKEHCENLATVGLRTLVFCFKLIDYKYYLSWNQRYNQALNSFENRKENINSVISEIENNMEFLSVSGVDDLLQEDVSNTIDSLRNAGIKIWMLTGDKVETATCISISTGIKSKNQSIKYITEDNSKDKIKKILDNYSSLMFNNTNSSSNNNNNTSLLVIDGNCLDTVLNSFEEVFFKIALNSSSVICCRCSPTQKAQVVKLAKKYTNKRLSSVGDGGNDVAMIQEAHVGIGIVGKEGMQASLASDFSINKFKDLNYLLLWHGRISYKNTAKIAKFIIHRGLIISLIQVRITIYIKLTKN